MLKLPHLKNKSQQLALRLACYFLFSCISNKLLAQFSLSGNVSDSSSNILPNCNVLLLHATDSSLIKGTVCNAHGFFLLQNIEQGNYLLGISCSGFEKVYKYVEFFYSDSSHVQHFGNIALHPKASQLDEVTLISKKPLFEQKIDRLVVNVKNSLTSAGGSVLDVLAKSPGININRQDGSITMSGKNGVQVMINGKLSYMPANALLTMLEGISANNVEKIELISTPPAKYDAGGNAGYINIVMQQNPNLGFNGAYSLTMAGWYGTAPAANFDFNYRNKKANIYGSIAASRRAQDQFVEFYRKVGYQNKITETNIHSERDPYQLNFSARVGIDYKLTQKTTIGLLASGYNNRWQMDAFNTSSFIVNGAKDSSINISNQETNHWKHGMVNVNLTHALADGEISINADYLHYYNANPTDYTNQYFNPSLMPVYVSRLKSAKKTIIDILPVQVDYRKKISSKAEIETGVKGVFSTFTNNVLVASQQQNLWVADSAFTANYLLKENIGAAYISVMVAANTTNTIKAGLRYEYTFSNLGTEATKNIVDRKYGYFFPTFFWNHKINDNNSFTLSYNRRINRPTFNNLAPFLIFIDPNTFISGNAALQPSIADGAKADYTLKKFLFSVGYTTEQFTIGNFQVTVDNATNKQYLVAQNLTQTQTINGLITLPFNIAKWWTSNININAEWQQAKARYMSNPVNVNQFSYNISGAQSFTLPKKISAEISGFYNSASLFGITKIKPFGSLNVALQKKFNNSSLKFGVDDIFSTMKFRFVADFPSQQFYTTSTIQMSRSIFKLTFTKNFGNNILKEKRERITASDTERKRVTE